MDNRSNVNTYDEVISFTYTNTNYHLQKGSFVYEITARPISITINNRQCEYGDDVIDDNSLYKITNGTIVNGDNLYIDLTVNLTGIKPNTYSITGDWNNSTACRILIIPVPLESIDKKSLISNSGCPKNLSAP